MLYIYIRQLHDTSKNKDVTTAIKDIFGRPVRINSTQNEFRDGGGFWSQVSAAEQCFTFLHIHLSGNSKVVIHLCFM